MRALSIARMASSDSLCVRVLWGEQLVGVHQEFPFPSGEGQGERRFEFTAAPAAVRFGRKTRAVVTRGDQSFPLAEVATETDTGFTYELARTEVVTITSGPLTWEAKRVKPPRRVPFVLDPDYGFLNTLIICLALFGGMAMKAEIEKGEMLDDSTRGDLTRVSHILVKPQVPVKPTPKIAAAEPEKKPKKVKPAEGSPSPLNTRQVVSKEMGRGTSLPSFKNLFGGPGTGSVLGAGGLGKELKGALGNVTASNGTGLGGMGLKGNGLGGSGGDRADLGSIGTSGAISYKGGVLCAGPGPCKKEVVDPFLPTAPILTCGDGAGPCMDKELIRKVIHAHVGQVRSCYEMELQRAPSLAGKISVTFMVGPSGSVAAAQVGENTSKSAELGDCLARRVRTWSFPVEKAGLGYRVTYPFIFKPTN